MTRAGRVAMRLRARAMRRQMRRVPGRGAAQIRFWFLALAVGIVAALAAAGFRAGITLLQGLAYGVDDIRHVQQAARELPWLWVLLLPAAGGLVVGVILTRFTPDGRVRSVADVIKGAALDRGRVEIRAGLASALASMITLSTGGSSGREGPVVHLAGTIATWVSDRIRADGLTGRDLLGCAVAAAVSASFNAPIAGALFALEVVLRHFAVHAFAPIAIASVAGTVIGRSLFGETPEFARGIGNTLDFYVELPAFLVLGLVCGLAAVVLTRAIFVAEGLADRAQAALRLPAVLRPAVAGLGLGALALVWPHVIGVGYETTLAALSGELSLQQAVVFAVIKVVAVALTMAGRMGGGVFSPALMLGALTGLAFGLIATAAFPQVSGGVTLYALAGAAAVAAAVLGGPISTTMILFELTGDWQTGLAVLVAVSLSCALSAQILDRSFFLTQLERRGVHLAPGPQVWLLSVLTAGMLMRRPGHPAAASGPACAALIEQGLYLTPETTLDRALPLFEQSGHDYLPVVTLREGAPPDLRGALFHVDALRGYARALSDTAAEEHS